MPSKNPYVWPIITTIVSLLLLLIALPESVKQSPLMPSFLRNTGLHLGIDLAGGTQLDFRISEKELMEQTERLSTEIEQLEGAGAATSKIDVRRSQLLSIQEQQSTIVEAIRTVLERRINALGVSEATITPSYIGDEKHLLVECPGVVDTQKCIEIVGKTITLEFKEEHTEASEEYEKDVRARVRGVERRMTESGHTLAVIGEDLSDDLGVAFADRAEYFRDELPKGLESMWSAGKGKARKLDGSVVVPVVDEEGVKREDRTVPGIFLAEVLETPKPRERKVTDPAKAFATLVKQEPNLGAASYPDRALDGKVPSEVIGTLRGMPAGELRSVPLPDGSARILFLHARTPGKDMIDVSHLLLSYASAPTQDVKVKRSKEEALALIQELKGRIAKGENFERLAREMSDGPSAKKSGNLGTVAREDLVPSFADAAFKASIGQVVGPIETQFGYHLIRVNKAPWRTPDKATYDELIVRGKDAQTRATALLQRLVQGQVTVQDGVITVRHLFFSLLPTGWKDTLLGSSHFRAATVTLDSVTNIPLVQISFDDEGGRMFQELTKKNIGKRIAIFVGGELVSAPTVQQEIIGGIAVITGSNTFEEAKRLATDLNTGAMPAPIYLAGQRTVEATLGASALAQSLKAALIGTIILMLYMVVMYRMLGILANASLCIYAFIFFALLKMPLLLVTNQYIVLTLAGMAGIILSIGMAVDANVLIFERIKEELRKGKLFSTAVDVGFQKAWPSIRDGNVSTLITSAILFLIGTSIVRGFALTLSVGVFISMFTAIIVTKWFTKYIAKSPLSENLAAFGVRRSNG